MGALASAAGALFKAVLGWAPMLAAFFLGSKRAEAKLERKQDKATIERLEDRNEVEDWADRATDADLDKWL